MNDKLDMMSTPEAAEAVRFVAERLQARTDKSLRDANIRRNTADGSYSDALLETLTWQEATRLVTDLANAAARLAKIRFPERAEGHADAGEQVRSEAEPVPSPATQTKGEG